MEFIETSISGLKIVQRSQFIDNRGGFERLYCKDNFETVLGSRGVKQANFSTSTKKGTLRGLHFQTPPHSENKIISCLSGAIWDVVVDIRANSPTFLRHFAIELSSSKNLSLLVPEGFAHGFLTLTDDANVLYFSTSNYFQKAERTLNPFDPKLAIKWPEQMTVISEKDKKAAYIDNDFLGIELDLSSNTNDCDSNV